jgi:hypothetical protein
MLIPKPIATQIKDIFQFNQVPCLTQITLQAINPCDVSSLHTKILAKGKFA